MSKKNLKILIPVIVLMVAVIFGAVWFFTRPETDDANKEITVDIIYDDTTKTVEIKTDEEYLRGALEQEELIKGDESDYGLFVTEVDGRIADSAAEEWWCFTKDGESLTTGVDTTPIADGDKFEVTLTAGW